MHRTCFRAGLAAIIVSVGACGASPPKLDSELQWREAIGNLGMFAIYPPSEDVMVGDVFLYVPAVATFDMVRVTSVPGALLARQFCFQEDDRPALDTQPALGVPADDKKLAVAAKPGGEAGNVVCPKATKTGTDIIDDKAAAPVGRSHLRRIAPYNVTPTGGVYLTRLREEAIPTLDVGRFSQAEIAGGITSGNFGVALGLANSAASGIRLELRQLQSATLEELRTSRLIEAVSISRWKAAQRPHQRGTGTTGPDYPNSLTPLMLARSLTHADNRNGTQLARQFCRGEFDKLNDSDARVVVANRVMYAGGVTFNFMSEHVTALRTAIDFASVLANMPQAPKVLDVAAKGGAAVAPTAPVDGAPASIAGELARLMKIANDSLSLSAGGPGQARARLAIGNFGTLALTREFARPAAVGMGAALHFPIAEAAVPVNRAQIEDVVAYCKVTHDVDEAAQKLLKKQMDSNLTWVKYLVDRDAGVAPVSVDRAQEPASVEPRVGRTERTKLRALVPSANIRVRL